MLSGSPLSGDVAVLGDAAIVLDLRIEEGELTATMKVRRSRVMDNFRSEIEELYEGKDL